MRRALFLDRDGVINVDHGYVHTVEKFEFIPGIFDLVRAANDNDYLVVVVTNQAGIGRGIYSEDQFNKLTKWMIECFRLNNSRIDRVYYCPFHPEHGLGIYKKDSKFRKPAPGMLLKAAVELKLDLTRSMLIGDKSSDILAAKSAGIHQRYLFNSTDEVDECVKIATFDDVIFPKR